MILYAESESLYYLHIPEGMFSNGTVYIMCCEQTKYYSINPIYLTQPVHGNSRHNMYWTVCIVTNTQF